MSEQSTEQQPDETASTQQADDDAGTTVNVTGNEPDVNVHGSGPSDGEASGSADEKHDGAEDGGSAE